MTPFEQADEDEDTQVIDQDEAPEFEIGDRVEWRKQSVVQSGTVVETDERNEALIVVSDGPTGEPCPVLWGPAGIFSKVD